MRDAADVLGIPCVRYFYSPYNRTDQYSLYSTEHGTPGVAKSYDNITDGMVVISNLLLGRWRREHGLPKVKSYDHYQMQNGRPVLTLYPVPPSHAARSELGLPDPGHRLLVPPGAGCGGLGDAGSALDLPE